MKNGYRIILICLAVLGVVYASAGPEKKAEEEKERDWPCYKDEEVQYKPVDLCKFPLSIEVGRYIQLKECNKRKIELKQVKCSEINQDNAQFPCYKGSDVIEVRANFPAIFSASIEKNDSGEDMLEQVNLYWENGVNTIKGNGEWEELKLNLEAWKVKIWKSGGTIGTVGIGDITIGVRPPDETKDETHDKIEDKEEEG